MGKPKTTKKPRVGFDNKFSPGSKKLKKTQLKKAERREGKSSDEDEEGERIDYSKLGTVPLRSNKEMKREKKKLDSQQLGTVPLRSNKEMKREKKKLKKGTYSESADIARFITAVSSRNYAQANKYLKAVVEQKIQERIQASLNQPLF